MSPLFDDPFFRRFFDIPDFGMPQERQSQSLGSGVIVDAEGFIITNDHVIRDADQVRVALADGREYDAEIALRDERTDLAVLKISAPDLPVIPIGNSDALEVGDIVLAIGNPFGVGQTVTSGIVSGLARTNVGITDFGSFIQTDAAINPGNSGGALVSMSGELIGINTAIFTRSGGSHGIGFAIPTSMVNAVLQSARGGLSAVVRPWLGADLQTVTSDIAQSLGLDRPQGALITRIEPESPAASAGLRQGDLVLSLDGAAINDAEGFSFLFSTKGVDGGAAISFRRGGETLETIISLEPAPAADASERLMVENSVLAGATVEPVTPATVEQYRLAARSGMVISAIAPRSPAASIGLQPGDVVLAVNGVETTNAASMRRATSERTRSWQVTIQRGSSILRQFFRT